MSGESGTPRSWAAHFWANQGDLGIACVPLDVAENLERDLAEERRIVDRIWAIFGSPTYEELQGKSIYDLVQAAHDESQKLQAALSNNALQEAQIAGMGEDAERYRWLRDDANMAEIDVGEMVMVDPRRTDANFDAAIEAMREAK